MELPLEGLPFRLKHDKTANTVGYPSLGWVVMSLTQHILMMPICQMHRRCPAHIKMTLVACHVCFCRYYAQTMSVATGFNDDMQNSLI